MSSWIVHAQAIAGQASRWQENQGQILKLSIVLAALLLVMWVVVQKIRKWMRSAGESEVAPFSLSDFRRLRAEGRISEAEYQSMREAIVRGTRRMLGETGPSSGPVAASAPGPDPTFRLLEEGEEPEGDDEEFEADETPDNPPEKDGKSPEEGG